MSEEELARARADAEALANDERNRTRRGFQGLTPEGHRQIPQPEQATGPNGAGDMGHTRPLQANPGPFTLPDPGFDCYMARGPQMSTITLASVRAMIPHIAHLPDEYIQSQSIDALIKANTAAKSAESSTAAKGAEGRLNNNFTKAMAHPVDISGTDNRASILHPARFLGGAGVTCQQLWHAARLHQGAEGEPAIGNYDMKAVGCSGCVTAKGWQVLHNPGDSEIALKLFSVANVSHVSIGSKTVTLSGEDGLTIHDNMKNVSDMAELKMALRTLREAASFALPWNKSFSVLEGFLITHDYMEKEVDAKKRVTTLTGFIDHVLKLNAGLWIQGGDFLAGGELTAAWDSWWGTRKHGYGCGDEPGQSQNNGGNNQFQNNRKPEGNRGGGRGGGNFRPFNQRGPGGQGQPRQGFNGPPNTNNICRNFNDGKCTNPHMNCFFRNTKLYHRCNYMVKNVQTGKADLCLQLHPRVNHK